MGRQPAPNSLHRSKLPFAPRLRDDRLRSSDNCVSRFAREKSATGATVRKSESPLNWLARTAVALGSKLGIGQQSRVRDLVTGLFGSLQAPMYTRWDACRFIPGRWYESPSRNAPLQFRSVVHSPYDGDYRVSFFDPRAGALWEPVVGALDELDDLRLVAPPMPVQAAPALRELMPKLLSPRADVRAEAVHRIADLGEGAILALPWMKEMAFYDDIEIHDRQLRRTNPRAQAQHALRHLSEIPVVWAHIQELPKVVDPWVPPPRPPEPWPRLP